MDQVKRQKELDIYIKFIVICFKNTNKILRIVGSMKPFCGMSALSRQVSTKMKMRSNLTSMRSSDAMTR